MSDEIAKRRAFRRRSRHFSPGELRDKKQTNEPFSTSFHLNLRRCHCGGEDMDDMPQNQNISPFISFLSPDPVSPHLGEGGVTQVVAWGKMEVVEIVDVNTGLTYSDVNSIMTLMEYASSLSL